MIILMLITFFVLSIHGQQDLTIPKQTRHNLQKRADQTTNWGYIGANGPLKWADLNPSYSQCANGRYQSPINVRAAGSSTGSPTATIAPGSSLSFHVGSGSNNTQAVMKNIGKGVEIAVIGSMIGSRRKVYTLLQFHFHTPGEHLISGRYFPSEVHFVFQARDGSMSVVGIPIEISTTNTPVLQQVFARLDAIRNPGSQTALQNLDFRGLGSTVAQSNMYQYVGSLTTPPCQEGIAWNVMDTPLTLDVATFAKLRDITGFNSRYVQNDPGHRNLLN